MVKIICKRGWVGDVYLKGDTVYGFRTEVQDYDVPTPFSTPSAKFGRTITDIRGCVLTFQPWKVTFVLKKQLSTAHCAPSVGTPSYYLLFLQLPRNLYLAPSGEQTRNSAIPLRLVMNAGLAFTRFQVISFLSLAAVKASLPVQPILRY